ncbi:MAG: two-component system sensor histidine kinase CreC [Burkholderiales bacterium]
MTKRNRVFIGVLLAYVLGVGFLMHRLLGDIDPRYRESAEESLVETAHLLATSLEVASKQDGLQAHLLRPVFQALETRRFEANIFGFEKTRVELRVTVVNPQGVVLYDSLGQQEGRDHSRWRDVRLALRGEYGARTTADVVDDPSTTVMYVAAPIHLGGQIAGAVSVGKPVQSFGQYVEAARRKTMLVGLTSVVAMMLLVLILSVWLVRPFGLVADYVRYVRAQRSFSLPRLGRRALGVLGAAYDEMRDALAGRNYVADYVQTLTHEVKSPLCAIRGAAELLQEPMPDADRARFTANIVRETERVQELIDRMMELTALESRCQLDQPSSIDLRALVQDVVGSHQTSARARQVDLLCLPAEDANGVPTVEGDAFLLRRALSNLIDNAVDFSPAGGRVTVSLTTRRRIAEVTIRDQGPGIPDYAEDKVFEKFYSLARPHSHKKAPAWACLSSKKLPTCTGDASA